MHAIDKFDGSTIEAKGNDVKLKLVAIGLIAIGLLPSAPAFAASATHSLGVTATVTGNCKFNTAGPTAVTIANSAGSIDPSVAVDATGTASVLFRCTTGTTSGITASNGLNFTTGRNVKIGATTSVMPYTLALTGNATVGTGFGAGQDKTLGVTATIIQANFVNAIAGTYTDTVVLTITP